MHAMLLALARPQVAQVQPAWYEAMEALSETSRRVYRQFVYETPGFLDYWQQATPISELSQLPISSRPAKRTSQGGFTSIRAIPWIFSWMQSRAIIPSSGAGPRGPGDASTSSRRAVPTGAPA